MLAMWEGKLKGISTIESATGSLIFGQIHEPPVEQGLSFFPATRGQGALHE